MWCRHGARSPVSWWMGSRGRVVRSGRGMAGRERSLCRRPYDSFSRRDVLWYVLRWGGKKDGHGRQKSCEKKISFDYVTECEKKKPLGAHLCAHNFNNIWNPFRKLTSTMGISSGPGPGWLGPLARLRLGCSGHMFCRRWLCIFFLCFLLRKSRSFSLSLSDVKT